MRWRKDRESSKENPSSAGTETSVVLGPVAPRGRLSRLGAAVASFLQTRFLLSSVVVVLAVALVVVAYLNVRHDREEDAARAAGKTVAESVTRLLSYSPTSVEADLEDELDLLTGDFKDEFSTLVRTRTAPAAQEQNITTRATVVAGGIEKRGTDRVEVVLFINVAYSTPEAEEPTVQGSRVTVTAEKHGGDWKISALEPV